MTHPCLVSTDQSLSLTLKTRCLKDWSSKTNHLYNYLRDNNNLTPLQSSFIPVDSTVNQLTYLYNTICQALDHGKEVRAVFCDISKAFDRVWHAGLIHRLEAAGVSGAVLNWFGSYLSDRKQSCSPWCYFRLDLHFSWCPTGIYPGTN